MVWRFLFGRMHASGRLTALPGPTLQVCIILRYSRIAGRFFFIDSAYQAQGQTTPTLCTDGINGINTNFNRFLSDSIEDDPANSVPLPIPNPPTNVNVVFGTDDTSNAVPQGYAWWGGVGPQPPAPTCVPVTPHAVPSTSAGAAQIVTDIQKMCIVH